MFPCPCVLARLLRFCTNYILKGPALPLILFLPQFQCFGAPRAQASSGGTLLSIYSQRGYQRENTAWLPCSLLIVVSLAFFPQVPVNSISWAQTPLQAAPWAPRSHHPPLLFPSTTESGSQLVDVSQHKTPIILSQTKPLDGPPGLVTPGVASQVFPGTIFSLGPFKLPSAGGPLPWQCAEHCVSASSRRPLAHTVPQRAHSPRQRSVVTQSTWPQNLQT